MCVVCLGGGGLTWGVDTDADTDVGTDVGTGTEDELVLPARAPPPRDLNVRRREFLDALAAALSGPLPELREPAPTTFAALAVWLERETCQLRVDVGRIKAALG